MIVDEDDDDEGRRQANAALGPRRGEPAGRRRGRLRPRAHAQLAVPRVAPGHGHRTAAHRARGSPQPRRAPRRAADAHHHLPRRRSSSAFGVCFWQNDLILEILDRPLEKSAFTENSDDPLERTAEFQQAQKTAVSPAGGARARDGALGRAQPGAAGSVGGDGPDGAGDRGRGAGRDRAPAGDAGRRRAVHGHRSGSSATRRCCSRCRCCSTRRTRSSCRRSRRENARSRCR